MDNGVISSSESLHMPFLVTFILSRTKRIPSGPLVYIREMKEEERRLKKGRKEKTNSSQECEEVMWPSSSTLSRKRAFLRRIRLLLDSLVPRIIVTMLYSF